MNFFEESAITSKAGNIEIDNFTGGNIEITNSIITNDGSIAINNIDTVGKMTISGPITGNNGNIDIIQKNAGELTINSKIHEINGGHIAIKNTNSGDIIINQIDEDTTTNPTIINDNGNIEITNTGTSDIFQFSGLKAAGSIDVFGVDRDEVNALVPNAQRNDYSVLNHNFKAISKFQNEYDRLAFYGYDFKANDVVLSINDYADRNRSVSIDTLYANNAYINTAAQNLKVEDGIISNYAEFRNGFGYSVDVDNDYRRLVPATVQLYTALTGSFRLSMSNLIKTYTSAPVVHYQWDKLVNTYDSENSFVRLGLKETEIRQKNKNLYTNNIAYILPQSVEPLYEVVGNNSIFSNFKILEISRTKATIINKCNWQVGEEHEITLGFDDVNVKVQCIVTEVEGYVATIKFLNMPGSIANKLTYHYMKSATR